MIFQRRTGDHPLFSHSARLNWTPVALLEWVHSQRRKVPMRAKVRQILYACATKCPVWVAVHRCRCVVNGRKSCQMEGFTTRLHAANQVLHPTRRKKSADQPLQPKAEKLAQTPVRSRSSRTLRGQCTDLAPNRGRSQGRTNQQKKSSCLSHLSPISSSLSNGASSVLGTLSDALLKK